MFYTYLTVTIGMPTETEGLVREILDRVADKWTLVVLDTIWDKEFRFSRLQAEIGGISQKMLTKTLREMERDGLVVRTVYAEVPPRVEYRLTPLGLSLGEAVCGLWHWAIDHVGEVTAARARFDEKGSGAGPSSKEGLREAAVDV